MTVHGAIATAVHEPPSMLGRGSLGSPATGETDAAFNAEEPVDRLLHAAIGAMSGGFSPMGLAEAWFDWAVHLAVSPARAAEIGLACCAEAGRLAELKLRMMSEGGDCIPCRRSLPQDKRFRHSGWNQWPFALYAESHLALERSVDDLTQNIHGATAHHLAMLRFVGRQVLDLVAPSNSPLTNPEVIEATLKTGGRNLMQGAAFALEDWHRAMSGQRPIGADAFVPGKTVAVTKGRVVQRNRLAEVIQYEPTTGTVRPEPVLLIPAWIMKYYILDLRPENSLVAHLVDQGFTVFVISWKNPTESDRDLRLDDYRKLGVMPALKAALTIAGAKRAHAVGYCIGGTLLGITAAAMARDKDERLQTLTFLAAQTDFREAGELKLFIDESQLAILDDMMAERGVLEASQMAGMFNLLRSNDLIWSRMIRAYLLGRREPLSDIAAWSTDATRMPAGMHSEYLRKLYQNNDLAEGRFDVDGEPVSLRDIRRPIFAVGTEWDHVAPWRSVFKLHSVMDAEVTFALTNGGHNQGIVSPPGRSDRHVRIATTQEHDRHQGPDHWLARAAYSEGSWWPHWFDWLSRHSDLPVPAPALGSVGERHERAPGPFVFS